MTHRSITLPALALIALAGLSACTDTVVKQEGLGDGRGGAIAEPRPTGSERTAVQAGDLASTAGDRVFFAYDSASLDADARRVLDRQAAWLKAGGATLVIEGHADERGTREYNLGLGERRAAAVREYLAALGVPADRIRTISYGKERPQIAEHNESGWAQNRRAVSVVR